MSVEIENGSSCDPGHASFRGALSTESSDFIQSTSVQNLMTLVLAVPEIPLGATTFTSSSAMAERLRELD